MTPMMHPFSQEISPHCNLSQLSCSANSLFPGAYDTKIASTQTLAKEQDRHIAKLSY
jgi:hypothetical protein